MPGLKTGIAVGLIIALAVPTGSSPTRIEITDTIIQANVKRFGINLAEHNFYDSGQMMKNLLLRNPGFEGMIFRSILQCSGSNPIQCGCNSSAWPDGFWDGASYQHLSESLSAKRGTVRRSYTQNGCLFLELDTALSSQYLVLYKHFSGGADVGWWPNTFGGAHIRTEFNDLPPETEGKQTIALSSFQGGKAILSSFFDATEGHSFLKLRGECCLSFLAKSVAGERQLHITIRRGPTTPYLERSVSLQPHWKTYNLCFRAVEDESSIGSVEVRFQTERSEILLDDISLEQVAGDSDNRTAFRDEVVRTLRELRPGILRYWGGQLGETLDNQLAPPFARQRSGFSIWKKQQDDISYGLHEFLELCEAIGAEPYYVVPVTFSSSEMQQLIEYLAGGYDTTYGLKRAARGHSQPWLTSFNKIHLEIGNESWNSAFRGATIDDPAFYGKHASKLFQAVRNTSGYSSSKFDLIIGGQAVNPIQNRRLLSATSFYDSLALAPYQMRSVDSDTTSHDLYQPLLAEPQVISSQGYMRRNANILSAHAHGKQLTVYEVNLDTTQGTISQQKLDELTPSLGTGLAVIENMLLLLRELGIRDQMFWSLPQYSFKRSDGKTTKLYGAVIDMGASNRKRPQFLAIQLANRALQGDLIQTLHSGDNPSWLQSANNGVPSMSANELLSFAFAAKRSRSIILLNLSLNSVRPVSFFGKNAPCGSIHIWHLSAPSISSNNERTNEVTISEEYLEEIMPESEFNLMPHSMTVLTWNANS